MIKFKSMKNMEKYGIKNNQLEDAEAELKDKIDRYCNDALVDGFDQEACEEEVMDTSFNNPEYEKLSRKIENIENYYADKKRSSGDKEKYTKLMESAKALTKELFDLEKIQ